MASRSLCLPPALTHFWTSATRGGSYGTGSSPRKYGTNGIIPEFTNIGAVGWCGIRPADGTIVCCLDAKKSRNARRSSSAFIGRSRLPACPFELRSYLGFPLQHRLSALRDRGAQIRAQPLERAREVGGHLLGGVALHRLAHGPRDPERQTEAKARAHDEPEEATKHLVVLQH